LAGGQWPSLARQAAIGAAASAEENNPIGALLLDILVLFTNLKTERLFSRTMVESLSYRNEPQWAELRKGKQLTELSLARLLRGYGVRPRTIWIGDVSAKGYVKEDFGEVFRRYITKSQLDALMAEAKREEAMRKPESDREMEKPVTMAAQVNDTATPLKDPFPDQLDPFMEAP
jgi:hypothetical protein